jgi:acyl-CoA thioesterase
MDAPTPTAYFRRLGPGRFAPTVHSGGAWDPGQLHFSPVGGLIIHELERTIGFGSLLLGRVTFDILGTIAADELTIRVETLRPGRTITLLQATLSIGGRDVITARAWLLAQLDTSAVAGGEPAALPAPGAASAPDLTTVWPGGYIASLGVHRIGPAEPGRATVWVTTPYQLVENEPASALASYLTLVDTANGIAVRRNPSEWMFPNLDLTIHLHRQPTGPWVGLDTSVVWGPTGQGLTSTVLHDRLGAVGRAEQSLTIRPLTGD